MDLTFGFLVLSGGSPADAGLVLVQIKEAQQAFRSTSQFQHLSPCLHAAHAFLHWERERETCLITSTRLIHIIETSHYTLNMFWICLRWTRFSLTLTAEQEAQIFLAFHKVEVTFHTILLEQHTCASLRETPIHQNIRTRKSLLWPLWTPQKSNTSTHILMKHHSRHTWGWIPFNTTVRQRAVFKRRKRSRCVSNYFC